MAIDINIMCIKQELENINNDNNTFYLEKLNNSQVDGVIYKDNWYLYNALIGVGYNLYLFDTQDRTYNLVDFKEKKYISPYMKNMLQEEKKPIDGLNGPVYDSIIFNNKYIDKFEILLKEIIEASKIKTCIVFFRLQTPCAERYVGRISLKQFISMLKKEEIYLNTAYIISESEYN